MLASNILTYSDFLKDSKEPLEIRKAMVAYSTPKVKTI